MDYLGICLLFYLARTPLKALGKNTSCLFVAWWLQEMLGLLWPETVALQSMPLTSGPLSSPLSVCLHFSVPVFSPSLPSPINRPVMC